MEEKMIKDKEVVKVEEKKLGNGRHPISPTVDIVLNNDNPVIHFEKGGKCWVTGDGEVKKPKEEVVTKIEVKKKKR